MYRHSEIAAKQEENCMGINSSAAHRSADAAIIDGLYSKSLISAVKFVNMSGISQWLR